MARLPRIAERALQQRASNRDPARHARSAGGFQREEGEEQQRGRNFDDGIDYAAAAEPNETPSEARRRLLSLSAAEAVAASGRRFHQKRAEEQRQRHVRIKQEDDRETIVISDSDDEQEQEPASGRSRQVSQGADGPRPVSVKVEPDEEEESEQRSAMEHLDERIRVKQENEAPTTRPITPPPRRLAPPRERSVASSSRATEEPAQKPVLERDFPWPEHVKDPYPHHLQV